jgi:hypothetical protein
MKKIAFFSVFMIMALNLPAQKINVGIGTSIMVSQLDTWNLWYPSGDLKISSDQLPLTVEFFDKYSTDHVNMKLNIIGGGVVLNLCPIEALGLMGDGCLIISYDRTFTTSAYEVRSVNGQNTSTGFKQNLVSLGFMGGSGHLTAFFRAGMANLTADGKRWGIQMSGGFCINLCKIKQISTIFANY